jgi:hypothetical protein
MNGSKFNIHMTKEPSHKGPRKEVFEIDLGLPKERYVTFEKRIIASSLWLSKQALISDPQVLAKTGVMAISEMPDENTLAAAGIIKGRELIVDDIKFIDKMTFYHPEALWSFEPGKIYYGWKLSKGKAALNLSGCFLVAGTNYEKVIYYFRYDIIQRLMWHYLMAMLLLGFLCEPKTMARIKALVNVVTLLRKRLGKVSGIKDIIGEVFPVPRDVVKIYTMKKVFPLMKKRTPNEIHGVKIIVKSAS